MLGSCRVLDLTNERAFLCGKILGDFGADVIKIEPPGGEPGRNTGPFYQDIIDPEKSLSWFALNTSKRGITLNIETDEGRQILKRLVKTADFVIESFEPGYMDSLGLGYPVLEEINLRIIMTSISPFGQTGPYAHYKASDMTLTAMGGFMYTCGEPDPGSIYRISVPQSYLVASLHGAMGSMMAYYYRETSGEGQHLDISIQEATIYLAANVPELWDTYKVNGNRGGFGLVRPRPDPLGPLVTRWVYPCKDGYVNLMVGGGSQHGLVKSMIALLELAEQEGMAGDLKDYDWSSYDSTKITQEEVHRIEKVLMSFIRTKTKQELYDAAVEKSIILVPLQSVKDILESPQLAARDYFVQVYHPELGETITYPGAPVKLSEAPWKISRRAPLIGEHNSEIYEQELGVSLEQLAK
ncbi:CaiB/BaiF CoA transferase family protein, partial [Chloroflexota bacterium]